LFACSLEGSKGGFGAQRPPDAVTLREEPVLEQRRRQAVEEEKQEEEKAEG